MKKGILVIALFSAGILGIIVFSGCAGTVRKDNSLNEDTFLEPQAALKFSDIPAPVGFKFLAEDSYTFESAGVRVGVLKYRGKHDAEQVVNFYKNQMPLYNWMLLNTIEYGERLLNFERERETCIVKILPKGSKVMIIISLGPKAVMPPKKSDQPVK